MSDDTLGLNAIRERHARALTLGVITEGQVLAAFESAADIPALLDEVDRLSAAVEQARSIAAAIEAPVIRNEVHRPAFEQWQRDREAVARALGAEAPEHGQAVNR